MPQLFQVILLAQRIHTGPETVVPVAYELMLFGELFDRLSFPHDFIAFNVVNGLALKDIETAIDPAFIAMRLFLEVNDAILIEHKTPKSRRGALPKSPWPISHETCGT